MRRFRLVTWCWGLLIPMLLTVNTVSAQLLQGIPRSPLETLSGSTEKMPEGVYVMPWIAAGVVYDDNVFFQTRNLKQDDVFLRVTPGLQGSYQSTPITVIANYRFDSEVYNKFSDLNSVQQRQFGTVELRGRPSNHLNINGIVGYAQTHTPFELNFLTSAQAARFKTERYFVNPSTEYRFDAVTRFRGEYAFSKDIFADEVEINSNIFNLAVERRIGTHDWIGPGYVGRHFTFGGDLNSPIAGFVGGNPENVTSHALVATWTHEFTTDTRLDVRAGPRITNGSLDDRPEAYVGIRRRIQNGDVSLGYTSALTTVIGTVGATQTDSVGVQIVYEAVRHLTFTLAPTAAWVKSSAFQGSIYTGYVEAAYQLNKYMTAKGSAYFSYQNVDFLTNGVVTAENVIIPRNVYWLRLEFTYPTRWQ